MTASTTDLALQFAREILGWQDADAFKFGRGQQVVRNLTPGKGAGDVFNVTSLNAVLPAVTAWCDANPVSLSIEYAAGTWSVVITLHDDEGAYDRGEAADADLCLALMAAAVEAARKARAA